MRNKLEVIAWTAIDAKLIEQAGADRIELVVDLHNGGTTPSLKLVKDVCKETTLPVRVMIRDTYDSFIYDTKTMDNHIKFIKDIKELNVEGIVFGSLTKDNRINFEDLKRVIDSKGKMKLTFHRAFDELGKKDWLDDFNQLSTYDVDCLLTSGTKDNAEKGIKVLKKLVNLDKNINILAGKSISINNAKKIIDKSGVNFIHVGLSIREDGTINTPISIDKIKEIIKEINND